MGDMHFRYEITDLESGRDTQKGTRGERERGIRGREK